MHPACGYCLWPGWATTIIGFPELPSLGTPPIVPTIFAVKEPISMRMSDSHSPRTPSRRQFLKTASALAGTAAVASLSIQRSAHAAGRDGFRIGLIGCGGRGSGAAINAMDAGPDIKLVAMGDIFEDRLQGARQRLSKAKPDQVQVKDDHCFIGFDAYQKVLASDIDVVLIACASHFHPQYLKAAIAANKHTFCEKPHGVDVPGLKSVLETIEEAKKKNLAIQSGLCWRYDPGAQETIKRIRDGQIGEVICIQELYMSNPYGLRERKPEWNEMEYQYQNWYHFNWLSGDQTGQQLVHSLDKASWVMNDVPPVKAFGMGGRQVCIDPKYGDQYDHHAVVFEYANGVRVFGFTRDMPGCFNETSDTIFGTKGKAIIGRNCRIEGQANWAYEGPKVAMHAMEQKALFDALREGRIINAGGYMVTSTMLGVLTQMVCYTGQEITWEKAMSSTQKLGPDRYAFDAEPPVKPGPDGIYPTAMPGVTKFV